MPIVMLRWRCSATWLWLLMFIVISYSAAMITWSHLVSFDWASPHIVINIELIVHIVFPRFSRISSPIISGSLELFNAFDLCTLSEYAIGSRGKLNHIKPAWCLLLYVVNSCDTILHNEGWLTEGSNSLFGHFEILIQKKICRPITQRFLKS